MEQGGSDEDNHPDQPYQINVNNPDLVVINMNENSCVSSQESPNHTSDEDDSNETKSSILAQTLANETAKKLVGAISFSITGIVFSITSYQPTTLPGATDANVQLVRLIGLLLLGIALLPLLQAMREN